MMAETIAAHAQWLCILVFLNETGKPSRSMHREAWGVAVQEVTGGRKVKDRACWTAKGTRGLREGNGMLFPLSLHVGKDSCRFSFIE